MAVRRNIMVDSTQGLHEAGHFWPRLTKSLLACVILPVFTYLGIEMSASSCAFCPLCVHNGVATVAVIFGSGRSKIVKISLRGSAPHPAARRGGFAGLSRGSAPHPAGATAPDPNFLI